MKTTALIMAGGLGERFWPKSRKSLPKQFLSLTTDGKTMIQLTVERILPLVAIEDIYISTNESYLDLVQAQLPNLPVENIICEPVGRNTAPCIGLGAMHILKKYDDALMLVLPSDHLIKQNTLFLQSLKNACEVAEENSNLVTIGIMPDYPETGYGYIRFDENTSLGQAYKAAKFVEKPDTDTAKMYFESGQYLWNSGMFIWKVSSILEKMRELMPETYQGLRKIEQAFGTEQEHSVLNEEFEKMRSISIDYGILEHANDIYTIPGSFGWDDVGSWLALERINPTNEFGNVTHGNLITVDTKNCILQGGEKLIATVGVQNLIVVDTPDAILICQKENAEDIKKVLENLRICDRIDYI